MAQTSSLSPDLESIKRHLRWLCKPALPQFEDLRIEIAWGEPTKGPNRSRTFAISDLTSAAGFSAWINHRGCNVYVGATLKRSDTPENGRTSAAHAGLATCIPVDIDTLFMAIAAQVAALAKPQLLLVTGRTPQIRGQLFIRIAPSTDLAAWEQLHERIVRLAGGDENALGRNRLMRLAGTVSYPSPNKVLRGYVVEKTGAHFIPAREYLLADLLADVAPLPSRPSTSVPQLVAAGSIAGRSRHRRIKPPMSAVEAALKALPLHYWEEHRLWIKVGFALHDFDHGIIGLDLWKRFSHQCATKANLTDFTKLWQGFERPYTGHRITIDWLLREARRACPNAAGPGI